MRFLLRLQLQIPKQNEISLSQKFKIAYSNMQNPSRNALLNVQKQVNANKKVPI